VIAQSKEFLAVNAAGFAWKDQPSRAQE